MPWVTGGVLRRRRTSCICSPKFPDPHEISSSVEGSFSVKKTTEMRRISVGKSLASVQTPCCHRLTENGISTELKISRGSRNFGEHVPDEHINAGEPPPQRSTIFWGRSVEGFKGEPPSSSAIFVNTKRGRFPWPFP